MFLTKKQNRTLLINLIFLLLTVCSVVITLIFLNLLTGLLTVSLAVSGLFHHVVYASRIYTKIQRAKLDGDIKAELQRINAWGDKVTEWDNE